MASSTTHPADRDMPDVESGPVPKSINVRSREHEVGDRAHDLVAVTMPAGWQRRELTGRDYGVDLLFERYESKTATGKYLLFQVKGTEDELEWPPGDSWTFDVDVGLFEYADLFVVPLILAVCPIHADPHGFCWLWLQEYGRVVLDYEKSGWRAQKTVRVGLPPDNCTLHAASTERLAMIAGYPQRLRDGGQLVRLQDKLRRKASAAVRAAANQQDQVAREELAAAVKLIDEAAALAIITDLPGFTKAFNSGAIGQARADAKAALAGGTLQQLASAASTVALTASSLIAFVAIHDDAGIRRGVWEVEGGHLF
jgi:hypothetical protein